MRVVKARSALLSDYEVLQLLQDAEAAQRKQNRGRTSDIDGAHDLEVPSNLRTVQFESAENIQAFTRSLQELGYSKPDASILAGEVGLTKAERLQLVNHAPYSVVELHTAGSAVVMEAPAEMEQDPATAATYYAEEAEMAEAEDAFPEEHFEHEVSGVQMEQDEDE